MFLADVQVWLVSEEVLNRAIVVFVLFVYKKLSLFLWFLWETFFLSVIVIRLFEYPHASWKNTKYSDNIPLSEVVVLLNICIQLLNSVYLEHLNIYNIKYYQNKSTKCNHFILFEALCCTDCSHLFRCRKYPNSVNILGGFHCTFCSFLVFLGDFLTELTIGN